jgi:hypothetical protein
MKAGLARPEVTLRLMRVVLLSLSGTMDSVRADSICRTAGYVTRMSGGVGGGGREVFPYPDWAIFPNVQNYLNF